MQNNSAPQQQRLVWWVLWAAFQIGIVVIYIFLGKSSSPSASEPAFWQLGLIPALISGGIRWSLLPMFKDAAKALPLLIVGIALAELSCFLGIFIFPSHQKPLFIASVIGIFQFIPLYFDRYFERSAGE